MPELPEVETIREQLSKFLVGHEVIGVNVKNKKIVSGDKNTLLNKKIVSVRRFGKVTVIDTNGGVSIVTHVKMTGQFIYKGPNLKNDLIISKKVVGGVPGKHTHVIFTLDKGGVLYYNDYRRFSWMKIIKTKDVENLTFIKKLGPDPLLLKSSDFNEIITFSKRAVKTVLMDQEKISGIGNIYANDALWMSGINPKNKANSLSLEQTNTLLISIKSILKKALKYKGTSEQAYVAPDGSEGNYQNHTLVYGREGKLCKKCGKKIVKYMLSGRGTYVCPVCQK